MNTIETIKNALINHINTLFPIDQKSNRDCYEITLNTDSAKEQFGDLSCNAALVLGKQLKRAPLHIASEIASTFSHPFIDRVEIAGPGFFNIFLNKSAFIALLEHLATTENAFCPALPESAKERIVLEFVSANPTGPLHFGHGRGGIIGDVLGNIFRFLGHQVLKEFYINDAGTQIEKLGASLKVRCQQQLGNTQATIPEGGYQGDYLIAIAQECITQQGAKVIEKDDSFFQQFAKTAILTLIKKTLTDYRIHFDTFFSETTLHRDGSIERALDSLKRDNLLYEQDGALWFCASKFGDEKDRVVRKADGNLTYVAADIAYLKNKADRGATRLFMILGYDHHGYVSRLHGVQQALKLDHIPLTIILYQLVKIKVGDQQLRMSKRAGNIVTLQDVIDTVGTDVARFFYLNRKADAQLEFDLDLALKKTDENPVYYIQYAYVRTGSILTKAREHAEFHHVDHSDAPHIEQGEFLLLKKIISLGDLLSNITVNHQTHLLAFYVVELTQAFSNYYTFHRILDPAQVKISRARLLLISVLRKTLATTFDLLGISKPEIM